MTNSTVDLYKIKEILFLITDVSHIPNPIDLEKVFLLFSAMTHPCFIVAHLKFKYSFASYMIGFLCWCNCLALRWERLRPEEEKGDEEEKKEEEEVKASQHHFLPSWAQVRAARMRRLLQTGNV